MSAPGQALPTVSAGHRSNASRPHLGGEGRRWVPALRAWTGLVLMVYVTCHLANHALGLVSVGLMEAARRNVFVVWHTTFGEIVLLTALAVHMVLAIALVATRSSLRLAPWQWLQLGLGLIVPFLLAGHVAATVVAERLLDASLGYQGVLLGVWPEGAPLHTLLIVVVWVHGCLGLHYWWRTSARYARWRTVLLVPATALPALAIGGFIAAARETQGRATSEGSLWAAAGNWPEPTRLVAMVGDAEQAVWLVFAAGVGLALAWRGVAAWRGRSLSVTVTYPDARKARARIGRTLLDMSREAGIPHAAVCGGRARCSTCRVRVLEGAATLPAPGPDEARLLARLGRPTDVRLACQIRPRAPLTVVPLVDPPAALVDARADADPNLGREREIAVLFADLRGFTRLTEHRLPYDVVYLLNQFFRAMGEEVEASGGHLDKIVGDGLMAIFGLDTVPETAARAALRAAAGMSARLDTLNASLSSDLDAPLRLAIGLHLGPAVVGLMGHGSARQLTAIGDTVNVASRLETAAKAHDVQLVVSEAVLRRAGTMPVATSHLNLRGRDDALVVALTADARELSRPRAQPVA